MNYLWLIWRTQWDIKSAPTRACAHTQVAAFAVKSKLIFYHRFAKFAIAQHSGIFSTTTLTFKTHISNYCKLVSVQYRTVLQVTTTTTTTISPNQKFSNPVHIPALIQPQRNLSYGVYRQHNYLVWSISGLVLGWTWLQDTGLHLLTLQPLRVQVSTFYTAPHMKNRNVMFTIWPNVCEHLNFTPIRDTSPNWCHNVGSTQLY